MGKPSRSKGTRGELEVAKIYQAAGFDAKRVPNSGGLDTKGDLVGVPTLHVEVKRSQTLRLWAALKQTEEEAPPEAVPVLHFRRNGSQWYVALPLSEFIARWNFNEEAA